jgi:hypothetical protein
MSADSGSIPDPISVHAINNRRSPSFGCVADRLTIRQFGRKGHSSSLNSIFCFLLNTVCSFRSSAGATLPRTRRASFAETLPGDGKLVVTGDRDGVAIPPDSQAGNFFPIIERRSDLVRRAINELNEIRTQLPAHPCDGPFRCTMAQSRYVPYVGRKNSTSVSIR